MKVKIVKNTIFQVLGKIFGSASTLVVTYLVARNYGVSGYGSYTEIMAYVTLFYMVTDFGMNAVVVRESDGNEKEWFSNLLGLRIFWAMGLMFLALAVVVFLPYDSIEMKGFSDSVKVGIVFGSGMILVQSLVTTFNGVFQKFLDYGGLFIASFGGGVLTIVMVYLFSEIGAPIYLVVLGQVAGGVGVVVISYFLARKYVKNIRIVVDFEKWKKILVPALPLGAVLVFNLVYFRVDTLILTFYKGSEAVGIYGLGYKFFEFVLSLPTFFMNSVYPMMIKAAKENRERVKGMVEGSFVFLFLGSVGISLMGWFLAPYIIDFFGGGFEESVLVLRLLLLGLPFFFLSNLFMWYLIVLKKQGVLVYIYGVGMIFNVAANLIFIPRYSYIASSVITGLSELLVVAGLMFVSYRQMYGGRNEG